MEVLPDKGVQMVEIEDYNHVDYMWAMDADQNVNSKIRKFLKLL